ncbi:MAG TPA: YceI family protein [Actinomycetota bacterium]|nr:YceI family protein [Actinomycetota bacterium]
MTRFRIVPERSTVWIDARTNVHPVHAEATGVEGFVEARLEGDRLDLSARPGGRVELAVERIRSNNALFDGELRRRVEARRFPTIVGEVTEVREAGDGRYLVRGDLTFHGVTRTVEGTVTLSRSDPGTLRLEGEQTFDIRDFGLEPPRLLVLKAYPDVRVRVRLEARAEGAGPE